MTSAPPPDDPGPDAGRSEDPWARPDATSDPSGPGSYGGGYGTSGAYDRPTEPWSAPPPGAPVPPGGSSGRPDWTPQPAAPAGPAGRPDWTPQPAPQSFDPYRFGAPEPGGRPGVFPTPPPTHQYGQPRGSNGKAIAGLVLGILSLILCFLTVFDIPLIVLGIIFSALGLRAARAGGGGRGMAIAGLTCSIIGAVAVAALLVFFVHRASSCEQRYDRGTQAYNDCIIHGNA